MRSPTHRYGSHAVRDLTLIGRGEPRQYLLCCRDFHLTNDRIHILARQSFKADGLGALDNLPEPPVAHTKQQKYGAPFPGYSFHTQQKLSNST